MRILFLNQFFHPDTSATSQLLTDLAVDLVAVGHEVTVLAGTARYQGSSAPLPRRERYRGIAIRRIFCGRFDRQSSLRRAVCYARFLFGALHRLLRGPKPDVIVVLTTPPLIGLVPALVHTFRGVPFICYVADVYPEVAIAIGALSPNGGSARFAAAANGYIYASACGVIVLGDCMRDLLASRGVGAAKLRVVHNWADGEALAPLPHARNPFRHSLGLREELVLLYSGNLGLGHEFDTLCYAMRELQADASIRFVFIGEGARLAAVADHCREHQLTNVLFLPHQPREMLAQSLGSGDIGLVSMRRGCEGTMVASKIYGILAAGRPYLYIGPAATTMADLARRFDCGWHVADGDGPALVALIRSLAQDRTAVQAAGQRARRAFDENFRRDLAVRHFEVALRELIGELPKSAPTTPRTENTFTAVAG